MKHFYSFMFHPFIMLAHSLYKICIFDLWSVYSFKEKVRIQMNSIGSLIISSWYFISNDSFEMNNFSLLCWLFVKFERMEKLHQVSILPNQFKLFSENICLNLFGKIGARTIVSEPLNGWLWICGKNSLMEWIRFRIPRNLKTALFVYHKNVALKILSTGTERIYPDTKIHNLWNFSQSRGQFER